MSTVSDAGQAPRILFSRRAMFAGAVAALPLSTVPAEPAADLSAACARQLLADAREARLSLSYDPARDRFVFAEGEGERTEAEEDLAFYVKWGLRTRPRLRAAVAALLMNPA